MSQSAGFQKRRFGSLTMWIVFVSLIIFFLFTLSVNVELYTIYSKVQFASPEDITYFILFVSIISLIIISYLIVVLHLHRFAIQALEFQNAMYSSSLKVNSQFCIIADPQNTIVYYDTGKDDVLAKCNLETIDSWLKSSEISENSQDMIRNTISKGEQKQFSLSYKDSAKKQDATLITISKIDKPQGYIFIKASNA